MSLGERIKRLRKMHRLTQSDLAERAGVTTSFVSMVERGAKMPRLEVLESMADVLEVPHSLLLDDKLEVERLSEISAILVGVQKLSPEQVDLVLGMVDQMLRTEQ